MTSKFMKYGISISVVFLGGSILFERALQKRYCSEDYYQNAIVMLQKYEPGAQLLGRPIYSGRLNLGNKDEFLLSPVSANLSIPLKGANEKGILHVLASRQNMEQKWDIDQLDLELTSNGQRWKFYDRHMVEN